MSVERDARVGDDAFAAKVVTEFTDGMRITTLVHTQRYDLRVGGVRIVERGSLTELASLAKGMSTKSRAVGLPVDGLKCLVETGATLDSANVAGHLRVHMEHVWDHDDAVCFGPDMNCSETLLGSLAADPAAARHVTGTTPEDGGVGINQRGLTAAGVAAALFSALHGGGDTERLGEGATVGIQGVGAVGRALLPLLAERGLVVRAVASVEGTLLGDPGLDGNELGRLLATEGDVGLMRYSARHPRASTFIPDPQALFARRMDIFIPAARTTVLAMPGELDAARAENPQVLDGLEFVRTSGVSMVVEAANRPLTPAIEAAYVDAGVRVLPDVLINGGGFIGCWAEAQCRRHGLRCDSVTGVDIPTACVEHAEISASRNIRRFEEAGEIHPRDAVDRVIAMNRAEPLSARLQEVVDALGTR